MIKMLFLFVGINLYVQANGNQAIESCDITEPIKLCKEDIISWNTLAEIIDETIHPSLAPMILKLYPDELKHIAELQKFAEELMHDDPNPEHKKSGQDIQNSLPHRILLIGSGGMKKTALARFIVKQARINTYYLSPSSFKQDPKFGLGNLGKLYRPYMIYKASAGFVIDDIDRLDRLANLPLVKELYKLLDESKNDKNILIVATANTDVSENVKKFFNRIYYIQKSNRDYWLELLKTVIPDLELTTEQEKWCVDKIESMLLVDFEYIIALAYHYAKEHNPISSTTSNIKFEELEKAIMKVTKCASFLMSRLINAPINQ